MLGAGLGVGLRLSHVELTADFTMGGAKSVLFSQYRLMVGVPIVVNSSWEFRARAGYRGGAIGVGSELGGYVAERAGVGVECEFAMPLNKIINFYVSASGTILKGTQIQDVQPSIALGFEFLLFGSAPYRKEPQVPQIALRKLEESVLGFLNYFQDRKLSGKDLDAHLSLLMAATKKLNQYRSSEVRLALDAIGPMASYVVNHSDDEVARQGAAALLRPVDELSLESAMKMAREISDDKMGVMQVIQKLSGRKGELNNYRYLVTLYKNAIEDLVTAHPQTTLTVNDVLEKLRGVKL